MATSITPPASAPSAPPAAPPVPVAAPEVTPAATPTPTPAPAATPAAPSAAEPQSIEERLSKGWEAAKAQVEKDATAVEEPEAPPAAAPEVGKPPEVAAPEKPAEKVEEPAKPAEEVVEAKPPELPELDDGETGDPKVLADALRDAPDEVKKWFEAKGDLKNRLFGALRRDNENREIRQIIPDVETARTVTNAAATFQNFDNKFLGATSREGAVEFLNEWVKEALIVDDKGEPLLQNGKYQFHPALGYTFNHITSNRLDVLGEQAKAAGDERLTEALAIVREAMAPSSPALGEIPEELKPFAGRLAEREAAVTAKEQEAQSRQQRDQQAAHEASIDRAEKSAVDSLKAQLKPTFTASGMTEFEANAAMGMIGTQLQEELEKIPLYKSIEQSIHRRPPSEQREKDLQRHIISYSQPRLGRIAAAIIRTAKEGSAKRQTERQEKIESQQRTSRAEPVGASVTVPQITPQTDAQLHAAIVEEFKKAHDGQPPDLEYIMSEMFKRHPAIKATKSK